MTGEVPVAEPPLPRRTRRPIDGVRILLYGAATAAVVVLAVSAEGSFRGLAADLADLGRRAPSGLIDILGFASALAAWTLPVVLIAILIWRGRLRMVVELLLAGLAAALLAGAASIWLVDHAPQQFQTAFSPLAGQTDAALVPALPAVLIAVATVTSRLELRWVFQVALLAVAGSLTAGLLAGEASVAGTLVAMGTGRVVGLAVRMVSGEQSVAPRGRDVAEALTRYGHRVHRVEADPVEEHRRYIVATDTGPLGVLVLDREKEGAGMLARLVDLVRTREEILPRKGVSLRTIIDQLTLLPLALDWAGARTPRLRHVIRLGPDATLLVHDHVPGRLFRDLSGDGLTDHQLADLWQQLGRLRANQVAHRRLAPHTILAGEDGRVWLLNPSGGEVAAPDLAVRTDLAQALVAAAMVVGTDRAVASAVRVLGADAVTRAVPLLQAVVLTRNTRRALRAHRGLLAEIRGRIASEAGGVPEETVRVHRFRLLSLVTGVAAVVAVYLVGTQLAEAPLGDVVSQADWRWVIVAMAAMALNYVGATYAILGFVPEPIPFWRTMATQVTLGFVKLVTPAAVGGAAINHRLLTKAGVAAPHATASVAAYQLGAVAVTFPLIAVLAVISGSDIVGLRPSTTTVVIVVAAIVAGGLVALIPPIRRRTRRLWDDFVQRGVPRLLEVLGRPRKLAEAIGGILLQTLALIACFYACVRAAGGQPNPAALAVVQLVGHTVGSAAPTPGGLGAVEAAMSAGVTAIGVPAAVAVPAVLLFRIITFWLPILPGWLLWNQLQRRNVL